MENIKKRIAVIENELKKYDKGLFIVHYKDGSIKKISPKDSIQLILNEADSIEKFEETPSKNDNGKLADLVNDLLMP